MRLLATIGLTIVVASARVAQGDPPRNPLARPDQAAPAKNPLATGDAKTSGAMRFTRHTIRDPGINNIEAVSFLVPVGWKVEGGVTWFPDYSILANLLMRVYDPQTGVSLQTLPMQNFTHMPNPIVPMQQGSNYLGNIVWQPVTDPAEFVQTFYTREALPHLKGARVVGVEQLPKIAEEVSRSYGGQSKVVAARVRYAYENQGAPWNEDVYLTLVFTDWQMGTLWSVQGAYSFRAPAGQLDAVTPTLTTIAQTLRVSPDWYGGYMYVQQLFTNRMNQGIKDARAISDTITRNSDQIRQMFADSYRQRQESQDRVAERYSESIRGVTTYVSPYETHPVQLPSGYGNAWVNQQGEYVLSNDPGYDPNVGATGSWQRMREK